MSLYRFDTGVTLIGGGEPGAVSLEQALELAPNLIAADGGANNLAERKPEAIIGDLDSLQNRESWQAKGVPVFEIDDQDTTDFEKCLEAVEAPFFVALGFLGGRLDHHLAACHALIRFRDKAVMMIGVEDVCFHCPERLEIDLPAGSRFSLFPMAPVRAESEGLHWPLDGREFSPGTEIAVSNRVTDPVKLHMSGPGMLVMVPAQFLGSVAAALC